MPELLANQIEKRGRLKNGIRFTYRGHEDRLEVNLTPFRAQSFRHLTVTALQEQRHIYIWQRRRMAPLPIRALPYLRLVRALFTVRISDRTNQRSLRP
jgi:hypothetical protein